MRLMIVSTSAGAGHTMAAVALEEAATSLLPNVDVTSVDVLDFTSPLYRRANTRSYLKVVDRMPSLWGYLYDTFDDRRARQDQARILKAVDWIESVAFRRFVSDWAPDVILATHFLGPQFLDPGRRRQRDRCFLGIVVTDFHAHSFWTQRTADGYFVGDDELRFSLVRRNVPSDRISVTGIPIRRAFEARGSVAATRAALGLEPDALVVLVMGGGVGLGEIETAVEVALAAEKTQVVALTGLNSALEERLAGAAARLGGRLRVAGFVHNVHELMAAADVAVTKPGGVSASECMAMGLPMILIDPMPGQEERNCDYLQDAGVAVKAHGSDSLAYKLTLVLSDEALRKRLRRAALRARRPRAAQEIISLVAGAVGVRAGAPSSSPRRAGQARAPDHDLVHARRMRT
ncbi:MAG TPA: glycosyltransferase [Gaiellaceae bacterium]|nr:glycosyltransferase [Gaiellaceae bacterium]